MAVEQAAAQMDDSSLRFRAALSHHTRKSRPSWSLLTLMCDVCLRKQHSTISNLMAYEIPFQRVLQTVASLALSLLLLIE